MEMSSISLSIRTARYGRNVLAVYDGLSADFLTVMSLCKTANQHQHSDVIFLGTSVSLR